MDLVNDIYSINAFNLYNTFESGKLEKKMNVISDLAYYTCMNNNLLLIQQLFKQTLTQFFF